jgi:hypothetical protein
MNISSVIVPYRDREHRRFRRSIATKDSNGFISTNLGLKALWFTGGEWRSGFASNVLKLQYEEANANHQLKPSERPDKKRVSWENRPYRPPSLPKAIWVEDEDLYHESQRQVASLLSSKAIILQLSRLDYRFLQDVNKLFTNHSKLLIWKSTKVKGLYETYKSITNARVPVLVQHAQSM